ncbi:hypothetical protein [Eupransor demetentiae]|uniref:DUF722 domain-containing protein n=1 Tax=Eupransor demetentiae TaxID=3109584 RepID=A0ABP0EPT3_9LACO|nr:hypothetical protein R54876_GBNLAHCA_00692 [Lactobacillaceae bacterium LMG 33000]
MVNKVKNNTDNLFTEYFSGIIKNEYLFRKYELLNLKSNDDNIGGGQAKNVRSIKIENDMIRLESDVELKNLKRKMDRVKAFVATLKESDRNLLIWHYNKNKYHTWLQISTLLHADVSTCTRRLNLIKDEFERSIFNRYY